MHCIKHERDELLANKKTQYHRSHAAWHAHDPHTYIGCVRLAPLGRPRCVAVFFSRTNVGKYLHTFILEKNNRQTPGSTQGS